MLIGMVLVGQFNSVIKPLIILTSVIMSTVGVLIGLLVFNMPFVIIMTGVGMISLAGVVVNNAIVLVDYINLMRRDRGMSVFELANGRIAGYREYFDTGIALLQLGFAPDSLAKVLRRKMEREEGTRSGSAVRCVTAA